MLRSVPPVGKIPLATAELARKVPVQRTAINIGRLGTYFDTRPATRRRSTRVHQLCITNGLAAA